MILYFKSRVYTGFEEVTNLPHFTKALEKQEPLPAGRLF